jgi:hypothetical protein
MQTDMVGDARGDDEETNFVDDDDLQQALARTRKLAVKQRVAPEDIIQQSRLPYFLFSCSL